MFDVFKKLFGLDAGSTPPPRRPARAARPTGDGKRAWESRRRTGAPRRREAPTDRDDESDRDPMGDSRPSSHEPVEELCKTCGAALLLEWGGTCPNCRPKLASPKTLFGSRSDLMGATSLTLGWLVVLRSPDEPQRGRVLELDQSLGVLTRAGSVIPGGNTFAFNDEYVSVGHATIRRPVGSDRGAAFSLQDRRDPGPSANGTFVNARKLGPGESAPLSDGDVIRVGTTELLFKSLWLPPGGYQG